VALQNFISHVSKIWMQLQSTNENETSDVNNETATFQSNLLKYKHLEDSLVISDTTTNAVVDTKGEHKSNVRTDYVKSKPRTILLFGILNLSVLISNIFASSIF